MIDLSKYSFNKKLLFSLLVISLILVARLLSVAISTDNWPGFWYSTVHVLVVALGSYWAIRRESV